jgi:hypothetical protein
LPPVSFGHIDHVRAGELVVQFADAAFDEALLLLGGMVFGVLGQVAVRARFSDRRDYVRALNRFEVLELSLKRSMAFCGHGNAFHRVSPL